MSDESKAEDVTANVLALAIFRDNLHLHKQIDYFRQYIDDLRNVISATKPGPHMCGLDLWNWFNARVSDVRSLRSPP